MKRISNQIVSGVSDFTDEQVEEVVFRGEVKFISTYTIYSRKNNYEKENRVVVYMGGTTFVLTVNLVKEI